MSYSRAELWTKTALFSLPSWDGQVDHIHLCRTEHFDPAPMMNRDELAAENVREIRWWSPEELAVGGTNFAPRGLSGLPGLLDRLRAEGVPAAPISLDGC